MTSSEAFPSPLPTAAHTKVPSAKHLRRELNRFVRRHYRRRNIQPRLHIGLLGGPTDAPCLRIGSEPSYDLALRADLIDQGWHQITEVEATHLSAWITRSGTLHPGDDDFLWAAAVRLVFRHRGVNCPGLYIITRSGWLDLESGRVIAWQRVRAD